MDELTLQSRIVKEVRKRKGWAIKMANRHQGGIPDIFIKMYNLPPIFIECKKEKLALTPLQRETLKRLQIANMYSGWLVYKPEGKWHHMYIGADSQALELLSHNRQNCDCITMAGKNWEVSEIVTAIIYWSQREMDKIG
jgi:hypothetical protein